MSEDPQRLQKFLAACGVASRRRSEELILSGRVAVNGVTVTELGVRLVPSQDTVTLDGRAVSLPPQHTYLVMHKPVGCLTTVSDDRGRATVFDLLPAGGARLFPVGRLDLDSSGLLLLTDDGDIAHRLTHPRFGVEREYRVLVTPAPDALGLRRLGAGAEVQGSAVKPVRVTMGAAAAGTAPAGSGWISMVLTEGRKREVRMLCLEAGFRVLRLVRVRYGPLVLGRLGPGQSRRLSPAEVQSLVIATHPKATPSPLTAGRNRTGVAAPPIGS